MFIILLLTQGWKMTSIMTFQRAPGLDIPMSWVYVIIPVSCVLMLLYLFRETLRIVRDISKSRARQEG